MDQRRKRGYSPKLQTKWDVPYEVIDVLSEVVYRIKKTYVLMYIEYVYLYTMKMMNM